MMYMHYCQNCNRVHMLNGHKFDCPACCAPLVELSISYLEFANMDAYEREDFKEKCRDPQQLAALSTTYRMYKYSKWYKALQSGENANTSSDSRKNNTSPKKKEDTAEQDSDGNS